MCSSSSCKFRKYHGAFEGFGVRVGFATVSSGASTRIDIASSSRVKTSADTASITTKSGQTITSSPSTYFGRAKVCPRTSASSRYVFSISTGISRPASSGNRRSSTLAIAPLRSLQCRVASAECRVSSTSTSILSVLSPRAPYSTLATRHSALSLQRSADPAILANPPEVRGHHQRGGQRQEDDVQGVEAQEAVLPDFGAADQQEADRRADDRRLVRKPRGIG